MDIDESTQTRTKPKQTVCVELVSARKWRHRHNGLFVYLQLSRLQLPGIPEIMK